MQMGFPFVIKFWFIYNVLFYFIVVSFVLWYAPNEYIKFGVIYISEEVI